MARIVADVEKQVDPLARAEAQPILRAIEQVKRGEMVTEKCAFCGSPLDVIAGGAPPEAEPTSFRFNCSCGKSSGVLRGI